MRRTLKFDGTVYSRSSARSKGPPGEAEILALNPARRDLILQKTEWSELFPGTLNLKVDRAVVKDLCKLRGKFREDPVTYPDKYASIPIKRGGYHYYSARLKLEDGRKQPVLLRRCENPHKDVVEVLAPVGLRDTLGIVDGQSVNIRLRAPVIAADHWFTRADGTPANVEGLYQGGHAFLIASGPSFKDVNRGPLKYCFTMGMNNSPKAMMPKFRPNLWTCVDGADKFLHTLWRDPAVTCIVPDTHVKKALWDSDKKAPAGVSVKDCPGVLFFERTSGFDAATWLTSPGICWGNGSKTADANGVKGKRSVFIISLGILYHLGFRHVYLLGVDFNMTEGNAYSFDQSKTKGGCKGNNSSYKQLQWRCEQLKPHFDAAGFNVYNCNPSSKLTAFPFLDADEAVARAINWTDTPRAWMDGQLEDTAGLYQSKWYVCPGCGAHARWEKAECKAGTAVCVCGRPVTEDDRKKYARDPDQGNIASGAE